jgi:hypothetical protein
MTDKVSEGDVADATRSHEVETKQTLAPTLEDGTLRTADDGEPNPPTGAASSITISSEQFDRVMSAVKRMNAEGMQKQARELMDSFLSTMNNDVSTIMTPPPSQVNSGARGVMGPEEGCHIDDHLDTHPIHTPERPPAPKHDHDSPQSVLHLSAEENTNEEAMNILYNAVESINFSVSSNKIEDQAKAMRQALGREYLRRDDMLRLLLDRLRVEGWINERKVVIKASQLCTEEGQAKFVKTVAMAAGKSMTKEHAERTLQMMSSPESAKSMFRMMSHLICEVASEMAQVVICATESHDDDGIKIIGNVAQQRIDSNPENALGVVKTSLESLSTKITFFDLSGYKAIKENLLKFLDCELKDFRAKNVTLALRWYEIIERMRDQAHDQNIDVGAKPESPVEFLRRLSRLRTKSWTDEMKRQLLEERLMPMMRDDISKIDLLAIQAEAEKLQGAMDEIDQKSKEKEPKVLSVVNTGGAADGSNEKIAEMQKEISQLKQKYKQALQLGQKNRRDGDGKGGPGRNRHARPPLSKTEKAIVKASKVLDGFCSSYNLAFYKDKSCTHELGMRHCQENREHWAKVNDEEVKECNKCHDTAHLLSQNMIDEIEKEASE